MICKTLLTKTKHVLSDAADILADFFEELLGMLVDIIEELIDG